MTYRLQYFVSRLRAALKCIIDEPDKWDKAWVLDVLDVENVCMNSYIVGDFNFALEYHTTTRRRVHDSRSYSGVPSHLASLREGLRSSRKITVYRL